MRSFLLRNKSTILAPSECITKKLSPVAPLSGVTTAVNDLTDEIFIYCLLKMNTPFRHITSLRLTEYRLCEKNSGTTIVSIKNVRTIINSITYQNITDMNIAPKPQAIHSPSDNITVKMYIEIIASGDGLYILI